MTEISSEYLSKETYEETEKELRFLIDVKRSDISRRLEEASSLGDLSENSEYQDAKEEQLMTEKRIAELEDLLSRARVLMKKQTTKFCIEVGCFVFIKKVGDTDVNKYQIVGSKEADPVKQKISKDAPLGAALLNKKKGEKITVLTPNGEIRYTVINIE